MFKKYFQGFKEHFQLLVAVMGVSGFVMFIFLMLTLLTGGCASEKKDDGNLKIVTSFYPMYLATMNVTRGVEGVEVVNLTPPQTGCLHDYQLTPEDMKLLETADIFVINGLGMESFHDKVTEARPDLKITANRIRTCGRASPTRYSKSKTFRLNFANSIPPAQRSTNVTRWNTSTS